MADEDVLQDKPRERAVVHARARRQGAKGGSNAEARLAALRAGRPEVLSPAPSPVIPGASNWMPLGPSAIPNGQTYSGARVLVSGRVTEILVHPTTPSTLFVATARGGVWKTEDGGRTWMPRSDNEASLAIGAMALAPSSPDVLYAGTGEGNIYYYRTTFELSSINESYQGVGILKSTDGGGTWISQATAELSGACCYALAVHPTDPDTAFVATSRGLYRTVDGGGTWTSLTNGLPAISSTVIAATDVVIDPTAPDTVHVAFWAGGVYRTANATATNPSFSSVAGLPASISRVSLAIAPSAPSTVYATTATAGDGFGGLYRIVGGTFQAITLGGTAIDSYGAYTAGLAVDISTPDIVYVSGVSLYKAVRDTATGTWAVSDIGGPFHPDNHAIATHPTNHLHVYAGTDGGVYESLDGGATWDDAINSGLSLTQFEFINQHPVSPAVVFGGTQDNGTEQFRNSVVFHHAADGDGGAVLVDQASPKNVLHTYYGTAVERSTQGGAFGTFATNVSAGLAGGSLFYPPMEADATDPSNVAFGTDRLCLDDSQGVGGWPTQVTLPGISGVVSAIDYVNSSLIYAATSSGQVYRAVRSGTTWTAARISTTPLPSRWIWDVASRPDNADHVVVVMAGFGSPHVYEGTVATGGGSAAWADVSGTAPARLPDIPVNSLQIDPVTPDTMYVGTDIGVFRTRDAGMTWVSYNNGLPNTAVYDLKLHGPSRLLRAATHGRGLWERKVDATTAPNVELFVRDHLMDTAHASPAPGVAAAFADPLHGVTLGQQLWWWMCADAKIDSPEGLPPSYQIPVSSVDYVAFEARLAHRSVKRQRSNRLYVQVHNRGPVPATDAIVKALYANATSGLPDLPADFWTRFPGDSLDPTSRWTPIGSAQTAAPVRQALPAVVEWNWTPPATTAEHTCLLVVVDSAADPIPTAHRVTNIAQLVTSERRVGLRNLHVVDAPPGPSPTLAELGLRVLSSTDLFAFSITGRGWKAGLLIPRTVAEKLDGERFERRKLDKPLAAALDARREAWECAGRSVKRQRVFDDPVLVMFGGAGRSLLRRLPAGRAGVTAFLVLYPDASAVPGTLTVVQQSRKQVVGGNTFVLRRQKARKG
jgi:photosystem II stability/assembly factor-like uncharacterized protein